MTIPPVQTVTNAYVDNETIIGDGSIGNPMRAGSSFPPPSPAPGATAQLNSLVHIWGDSNAVGTADSTQADNGLGIGAPFAPVDMNQQLMQSDPVIYQFIPTQPLQPYGPGGASNMGIELSLGRGLVANGLGCFLSKFARTGSTLADFLPGVAFPTNPPGGYSLFDQMASYIALRVVESRRDVGAMVCFDGTNDAVIAAVAAAWAANMRAIITPLRERFGNFYVVIPRLSINAITAGDNAVATVREQQELYVASDPLSVLINTDDVPLAADNIHYTANSIIVIGDRCARAIADLIVPPGEILVGPPPRIVHVNPIFVATGAAASVMQPIADPYSKVGDDEYLHVTRGDAVDAAITLTDAQGFVAAGVQSVGTAGGVSQRTAVFRRRITQAIVDADFPPPTVNCAAASWAAARINLVRGCDRAANPIQASAAWTDNVYGLAVAATMGQPTGAETLNVLFAGSFAGNPTAAFSGWVDSDFSYVTEQIDSIALVNAAYQMLTTVYGFQFQTAVLADTLDAACSQLKLMASVALAISPV